MQYPRTSSLAIALLAFCATSVSPSAAQTVPWDVFSDRFSDSVCDLVNAANAELVVFSDTGQLVIVTGTDVILEDTVVDLDGSVFLDSNPDPVGFIDFAVDGDGFRTLWWTSLTGRVINVDGFTGEPTEIDMFPGDFFDVPCDACPFWDDPTACGDEMPPPISINLCGMNIPLSLSLTTLGLALMRLTRAQIV